MEQRYKDIKEAKEYWFRQTKEAEDMLKKIREECDHPEKHHETCTYMTRPGQYWEGTIVCGICGEVVKWPYEGMDVKISTFKGDTKDEGWLANRNHG